MSTHFLRRVTVLTICCLLIVQICLAAPSSSLGKGDCDDSKESDEDKCPEDDGGDGMSSGAVAGIVIGIILFCLGIIAVACYLCACCCCMVLCSKKTTSRGQVIAGTPLPKTVPVPVRPPSYERTIETKQPIPPTYATIPETREELRYHDVDPPAYSEVALDSGYDIPNAPPPELIYANPQESYPTKS